MKKFIVLYSAPIPAQEQMQGNPDDMKAEMEKWIAWFDKNKEAVVDMGTPLGNSTKVNKDGVSANQTWTSGYTIMQADSMENVTERLKDHPHLNMPQCEIQVYECFPPPGME